jgi:small membrane protein
MMQQLIAVFIILFFLSRLFKQKRKKELGSNEFYFWLIFWFLTLAAVIFIKRIDSIVASLGFSGSGIEVLLYLSVVILFYFLFKMRIKEGRMERDITRLTREIAIMKERGFSKDR